jgi:glycosyltransferase involved in cell wall biosynthesis
MAVAALVSFRLGTTDGVSVVAEGWRRQLAALGFTTRTVAGEGPVDRVVAGLSIGAAQPPSTGELADALSDADLVVVENLLTIPMNLPASSAVAAVLRGRPAILHHHDPPWQRARYQHVTELPIHDRAWRHVAISRLTASELTARGFPASHIWPAIDTGASPGNGRALISESEAGRPDRPLLLHPVRAIARKAIPVALALAGEVGGTYWLTGPAEEGYDAELARLLRDAAAPVWRRGLDPDEVSAAYAACDAVLFPSTWEGFGLPPIEAGLWRRPVVVGPYPVADELRALGFRWLPADDAEPLRRVLADPDSAVEDLAVNHDLVTRHFSYDVLRDALHALLDGAGWLP